MSLQWHGKTMLQRPQKLSQSFITRNESGIHLALWMLYKIVAIFIFAYSQYFMSSLLMHHFIKVKNDMIFFFVLESSSSSTMFVSEKRMKF